jgi:hypothetical protein
LKIAYTFLSQQVGYWKECHQKRWVQLYYKNKRQGIVFFDSRYDETPQKIVFDQIVAHVYKTCECTIIEQEKIISKWQHLYSSQEIKCTLQLLIENRLVYQEGNLYIGLAFSEKVFIRSQKEINAIRQIRMQSPQEISAD